jgi:hypothetical protein
LAAAQVLTQAAAGSPDKPYNILFILTDQERYFDPATLPNGYSLPTGQHIQRTKVFDNLGFPWSNELSLDTPAIGAYLQEVGYYPAYQGKVHMLDS